MLGWCLDSFAIKRARALPTRRALTKRSREPELLPKAGLTAVLAVDKYVTVPFLLTRLAFAEPPGFPFPGTELRLLLVTRSKSVYDLMGRVRSVSQTNPLI